MSGKRSYKGNQGGNRCKCAQLKKHVQSVGSREEDFAFCLLELQAGVGEEVLCFDQYFREGATSRSGQEVIELASEPFNFDVTKVNFIKKS